MVKRKNILVLGAGGMLGYAILEYYKRSGYNIIGLTRIDYDVIEDSIGKLERYLDDSDIVVNCIGVILSDT